MIAIPAVPPHDTAVIDEPWDAGEQVDKIKTPIGKAVGAGEWAWYDASGPDPDKDGYPDEKGDYKFPHHQVDAEGKPGAANVNGVRNALSRLSQADIPEGDRDGVKRHLQHHLDAFDRSKSAARAEAALAALAETTADAADTVRDMAVTLEPEPQASGIVSAGFSDTDQLRAERAPLELLFEKPWAITRQAAIETATRLAMEIKAGTVGTMLADGALAHAEAAARRPVAKRAAADGSEIAVIPLRGTITPRGSLFSLIFGGGGGLQMFREQFRQAAADGNVSAIVLDIDSPGGLIDLVPETAAEVFKARGTKPIVAVANTTTASAAYWIASQADSIVSTPSGMVGSIGVFTMHEDFSKMEQMMGIKTTLISAGDHKTDGNPYEPLSKAALQAIQDEVNQLYGMFTAQVAEGRGISQKAVQAGYGRGRCLLAQQAFTVGMVDRIETLEQTVARLGGRTSDPAAQAADVLQVGDGDEDDGITAASETTSPTASTETPEAQKEPRAKSGLNYLNGLREQSPWAL